MKPLAALAAVTFAISALAAPAFAAEYVHDGASMLSPATVSQLDSTIGNFYAQTHKEVLVDTVPSLDGTTVADAAERVFAQQRVNGVLIYIAKAEHKIEIVPDRASRAFFPSGSFDPIYNTMSTSFKAGDFNGGVTNAVNLIINTYRGHESALRERRTESYVPAVTTTQVVRSNTGGFNMGIIWWLIVLAVIFFVVRLIFRAMVGPRMYPPGYGGGPGPGGPYQGGPGYGPGYGGPGYGGPGYGYGGGGGGFWSGLLGGLGGAWLGNEMFGGNRGETIIEQQPGNYADVGGGGYGQDQSGFQNDAGQADMGNAAGGGWGDSSGGGWGGGDSGGGGWGGGDSGGGGFGGGGDSGGGW